MQYIGAIYAVRVLHFPTKYPATLRESYIGLCRYNETCCSISMRELMSNLKSWIEFSVSFPMIYAFHVEDTISNSLKYIHQKPVLQFCQTWFPNVIKRAQQRTQKTLIYLAEISRQLMPTTAKERNSNFYVWLCDLHCWTYIEHLLRMGNHIPFFTASSMSPKSNISLNEIF